MPMERNLLNMSGAVSGLTHLPPPRWSWAGTPNHEGFADGMTTIIYILCSVSHKLRFYLYRLFSTPFPNPIALNITGRGECVRLKNFVVNANIADNTIQHCGMYDFEFAGNSTTGGKNGEGIYIGTSSNQVGGG